MSERLAERLADLDHLRLRVADLEETLAQERLAHRVTVREQLVRDISIAYKLGPADRLDIGTGQITRAQSLPPPGPAEAAPAAAESEAPAESSTPA